MFGKVFATACFVTIPSVLAFDDSVPQGTTDAPVEVGVLLRADAMRVRNFSSVPQVLIFECQGLKVYRTLAVGTEIDWSFEPSALSGVNMEIASLKNGLWRSTGVLSLDAYATSGSDTMWVQSIAPHSLTWLQFTSSYTLFAAGPSFLPTYLQDSALNATSDVVSDSCAIHVPGPTPSNTPQTDGPPRIDPTPLPPM